MARKRTIPSPIQAVSHKTDSNIKSCSSCGITSQKDRHMHFQPHKGFLFCSKCYVHVLYSKVIIEIPLVTKPTKPTKPILISKPKVKRSYTPTKPIGIIIGYYGVAAELKSHATV